MRLALNFRLLPPVRYVLGGILLYFIFLLATAPAFLLNWLLSKLPESPALLGSTAGTLWSGEARGVSVRLSNAPALSLDRVEWRLAPLGLLRGELAVHVQVQGNGIGGNGVIARSLFSKTLHLSDFSATVPGAMLGRVVPVLQIWQPSGVIQFDTEDLTLREASGKGNALLRWNNVGVSLSPVKPLGAYEVAVEGSNSGFQYQVKTTSGPLLIEGKGVWAADKPPIFNGTARAQAGSEGQLRDLLAVLGRDEGNGIYRLSSQLR